MTLTRQRRREREISRTIRHSPPDKTIAAKVTKNFSYSCTASDIISFLRRNSEQAQNTLDSWARAVGKHFRGFYITRKKRFMKRFFEDKVVVVTGATDGIGKSLVSVLSGWNAKVAACGKDEVKVKQCNDFFSRTSSTFYMVCDVSDSKACEAFIQRTVEVYRRIDLLINNAGLTMRAEFADTDTSVIDRLISVNLLGTLYITKYALPTLTANRGTIVGISSIGGFRGLPGRSIYSASKFGINGFLESLRVELRDQNVRVVTVSPGFIASNIRFKALDGNGNPTNDTRMDEKKMMSTNTCALRILSSIRYKRERVVFSLLGKVTVLLSRLLPSQLVDALVYRFYYRNNKLVK